ncbi:MAG: chloride channel protein [Oscillospiraceae bacterium]|nr:chloride channel protein [Oscillospiraceae bacterium]
MNYHYDVKYAFDYFKIFIKWIACACIVGSICGLCGSLLNILVEKATLVRESYPLLLWALPLCGIVIVFLYRLCGITNDSGTNRILSCIRTDEHVPFIVTPLIFIATVLTHLAGGSSGRGSAALQMGGSLGTNIGELFHLEPKECHVVTMCGMSAVFASIFGTPLTAAIFVMEVISVGIIHYSALIPCILSSIIGYSISLKFGITPLAFHATVVPQLSFSIMIKVIILAAMCGTVSIIFCQILHITAKLYEQKLQNPYIRIVFGAALVIALTFIVDCRDYNGAGYNIIANALDGQAAPEAFLLKMIFTALTIGAGFKGGEIFPTFFVGATFGCFMGSLLGLPAGFAAAIGLTSLFCGMVNCPLASIILSIELFGKSDLLLFALACGVSYMLSGYYSLYSGQKIVYSKLNTEFIDSATK